MGLLGNLGRVLSIWGARCHIIKDPILSRSITLQHRKALKPAPAKALRMINEADLARQADFESLTELGYVVESGYF